MQTNEIEILPLPSPNIQTNIDAITKMDEAIKSNLQSKILNPRIKSAMSSREKRLGSPSAAFHHQTKSEEDKLITPTFIKDAQETGIVKLTGQGLKEVPEKIYKIQSLQVANLEDQYRFDKKQDFCWWHQKTIQHLNLSSNVIGELSKDIQELGDLVTLNLHDNALKTLPDEIGTLQSLTKCDISRNKLTKISEGLCRLLELTKLNLAKNEITTVSSNLTNLILLEELDLSENAIPKLPRGMGFLIRLLELNISHNKITHLPMDIVNLRVLRKLDVSHNVLTSLPDMGELRSLEFLYANNNKLIEIPCLAGCYNLKECYFGHNLIKILSPEFCKEMGNLKILDLPNNKIEVLPDEISGLQQIVRLNIQNNSLLVLPNTLCLLPHLQTLSIEGNMFKTLRRDIMQCGTSRVIKFLRERYESEMADWQENLNRRKSQSPPPKGSETYSTEVHYPDRFTMRQTRALNIANRGLSEVPQTVFEDFAKVEANTMDLCKNCFTTLPQGLELTANCLTELNISCNKLTQLPDYLSNFVSLKYLNASKNQISSIPECFANLRQLRELDLSSNRLSRVPECVEKLQGLEILDLKDNKITYLDADVLLNLTRLASLNLVNNSIAHVPPALGKMKQLRSLGLFGNCFRQPTHQVLEKGTEAVLAYLRDKIPA